MLGRKRARVFSKVAALSEKSRDAPPPSSLLPPSWRGAIRISRRILTSPMVQISVVVCVFLLVVLCLITSALCRQASVLRKVFPCTLQSLSPLALRRFFQPQCALSSSSPSVSSANVSHTLAASGISRLVLRRLRRPFFVGQSPSFTAAGARTMQKG